MTTIVDCRHCGGAGHRAESPCCYMAQGTVGDMKAAVRLATENPKLLMVCCSCRGVGQVILQDPQPSPK
jgi:hypothetical protein